MAILLIAAMAVPSYAVAPSPAAVRGNPLGAITLTNRDGQKRVINIADLVWVQYDENGNIIPTPRTAIDKRTIRNGATVKCYDDGNYFQMDAFTVVTVTINMDHDAKLRVGFSTVSGDYSGNTNFYESGTSSFELEDEGSYYFYITNKSSDPVTVSGEIRF